MKVMAASIAIFELNGANIRNGHIYLGNQMEEFFPPDVQGGSNKSHDAPRKVEGSGVTAWEALKEPRTK